MKLSTPLLSHLQQVKAHESCPLGGCSSILRSEMMFSESKTEINSILLGRKHLRPQWLGKDTRYLKPRCRHQPLLFPTSANKNHSRVARLTPFLWILDVFANAWKSDMNFTESKWNQNRTQLNIQMSLKVKSIRVILVNVWFPLKRIVCTSMLMFDVWLEAAAAPRLMKLSTPLLFHLQQVNTHKSCPLKRLALASWGLKWSSRKVK